MEHDGQRSLEPCRKPESVSPEWVETKLIEFEEKIYSYEDPGNGAGPLWCYGSPMMVRHGERVFASGRETNKAVPNLCNTRWRLYEREKAGWRAVRGGEPFANREPCPLVRLPDGKLLLSDNPDRPGGAYGTPCVPRLLEFDPEDFEKPPRIIMPKWKPGGRFSEHSYRGIGVDCGAGDLVLLNIDYKDGSYFWSFREMDGEWTRQGRIVFPVRACYPQVGVRKRAAHVLAIGDIPEPVREWKAYKFEQTGREWDFAFRRLFYAWTFDISKFGFAEPIEIDSVEATGGNIINLDLWIDNDGAAHLLFSKLNVACMAVFNHFAASVRMRDRFFPDTPILRSLEYVVIKEGVEVERRTLVGWTEGEHTLAPSFGRFHITPDGRLFVIYFSIREEEDGRITETANYLLPVRPTQTDGPTRLNFTHPFGYPFTTCTPRGGTPPANVIDMMGCSDLDDSVVNYARCRVPVLPNG